MLARVPEHENFIPSPIIRYCAAQEVFMPESVATIAPGFRLRFTSAATRWGLSGEVVTSAASASSVFQAITPF